MSRETDEIMGTIARLESTVDGLYEQKAQAQRYLDELKGARSALNGERASFFERLGQRRNVVASAGQISNAIAARGVSERMKNAFGSEFEAGVDAGFTGLARDVDDCIKAAEDKIAELEGSIRSAEDRIGDAQGELRAQVAKEQAEREGA